MMLRTGPSILHTHRVVPVRFPVDNHIYQQRKPAVSYPGCLPSRFCCVLQYLRLGRLAQTPRRRKAVQVWAAKGDSGKTDSADGSTSRDQKKQEGQLERADKKADSKTAENRADSKASSKTEAKADGKSETKSDKSKSSKPKHPEFDVSATASQGLKPVHLATFFIILGTGLMFLAVLLWFTADIRFQQACTKVIRRLFKTVALRQVMGILGAMTFVRLGLEPMVKMLRRLFRAPGSWEKSSEFYILREVCNLCKGLSGSMLSGLISLQHKKESMADISGRQCTVVDPNQFARVDMNAAPLALTLPLQVYTWACCKQPAEGLFARKVCFLQFVLSCRAHKVLLNAGLSAS